MERSSHCENLVTVEDHKEFARKCFKYLIEKNCELG